MSPDNDGIEELLVIQHQFRRVLTLARIRIEPKVYRWNGTALILLNKRKWEDRFRPLPKPFPKKSTSGH